jgi:hypothetical protein
MWGRWGAKIPEFCFHVLQKECSPDNAASSVSAVFSSLLGPSQDLAWCKAEATQLLVSTFAALRVRLAQAQEREKDALAQVRALTDRAEVTIRKILTWTFPTCTSSNRHRLDCT